MDLQDENMQTPLLEESNILERVARIISSVRGAKPDYAHLAAELEPALPFDIFGIVLLRYDRQAVRVIACQREGKRWTSQYHQHPFSDSMVAHISELLKIREQLATPANVEGASSASLSSSAPDQTPPGLLVRNFSEGLYGLPGECGDSLCGKPHLRAILIAPLIVGGNILGTLELGSTSLSTYEDPALQRLINAIARLLATAIEGAQVGGNVEIQNRQRQELKNVSTALTTSVDLPMILKRVVLGITNALHVASAIVHLNPSQLLLHLEAQSGLSEEHAAVLQQILDRRQTLSDQANIGSTLLHRVSRVSQDIIQDERFPQSHDFGTELAIRSIYCYPLITGKYIYGVLLLLSTEPGGFTPLKTDIFSLFASQATVAIHNGLLLQSAQKRRNFQEIIEQLENAHQKNLFANQDELAEQELLIRLREETFNTFGVSLSSVLHFISNHLLTRSERHLQEILQASIAKNPPEEQSIVGESGSLYPGHPYGEEGVFLNQSSEFDPFEGAASETGTALLMQSADAALAHTDFLRHISAALLRALHVDESHPRAYEQMKRQLFDPWLIVDFDGNCIYLNRAAELFCGVNAEPDTLNPWDRWPEENSNLFSSFRPIYSQQEQALSLEQAFAPLLPRMRQLKEALSYLREFTIINSVEEEKNRDETTQLPVFLRCAIAAEPLPGQEAVNWQARASALPAMEPRAIIAPPSRQRFQSSPSMLLESSPSDRHYQFVRHALYDEEGQRFASALYIHDVTEQVRDEKNKAVLLASVSHDLRTPLTTIKAAVTGLLQADLIWDEEMRREILEDIDVETDHLSTQINALVEMSRIAMGALVLEKEWCDLVELVHATLARSQRMLIDFVIRPHIQSPLPLIYADYAQLERVVHNLLENATRHSPRHSEIQITIDILPQQSLPSSMVEVFSHAVRVQVIDQGPRIPEEERERIFKSFYRVDAQDSGLGLAICRGIIEAHQGRIWVEPAMGGGSCFVFVLPITS